MIWLIVLMFFGIGLGVMVARERKVTRRDANTNPLFRAAKDSGAQRRNQRKTKVA